MSKIVLNGRDNHISLAGITNLMKSWIDQDLTTTGDPNFNSLTVDNDVVVGGDLTVNGTTTIISSDVLEIKDNIILINSTESGPGVTAGLAGVQINRGSLTGYQVVFRESDDSLCLGEVGNLQVIATREDNPLNAGIAVFNSITRRFDSTQTITLPITFNNGQNASSSADGTVRITGGIGISQDQYIDGRIYIKGNTYGNFFDVNSSQETIISSTANILLNAATANYVKIPADVSLSFGGNSHNITSNGVNLAMSSSGRIDIKPGNNQNVSLKTNSPLDFGVSTENIVYNGTNLVLSATNNFDINPVVRILNSTGSSSTAVGAMVVSGGISISNTNDATSSSNGGTFTTAGGVAIAKKLFVGGMAQFNNTDESASISSLGGATVSKKLIVGSSYSGNPATTPGIYIQSNGYTYTDTATATSGTVSNVRFNTFGINTLASTNEITTTNASTVYIEGAPTQGTNQNITNRYALFIDSGITRLDGDTVINSATFSTSSSTGALVVEGGVSIKQNLNVKRHLNVSSDNYNTGPSQGVFLAFGASTVNDDTTIGVATEMSFNNIATPTLTASNVITTTNASTFTIEGAPIQGLNQTITNSYALWVKDGTLKVSSTDSDAFSIDGGITITNTSDAVSSVNGGTINTAGGAGIAKKLFVGGVLTVEDSTDATTSSDGSVRLNGGLSVVKSSIIGRGIVVSNDNFGGQPLAGVNLKVNGNTYTDTATSASGTAVEYSGVVFEAPELSATNSSITTTNASTFVIEGAPTAGVNQTITNAYSMWIKGGNSLISGPVNVSNATTSTSSSTGALRVSGGVGIAENLNVGGNFDVSGATTLDQTTIDTTDGAFGVSGGNGVNISVAATSNYNTTAGNITMSSAGELILYGGSNITVDTPGLISIDVAGNSNLTSSAGSMTVSGATANLTSTGGATTITGSNTGGVIINTGDTTNGIKIGTNDANVPITIGHNSSEVIIGDNLTVSGNLLVSGDTTTVNSTLITVEDNAIVVNSLPAGLSDGGFLVKRYQPANDSSLGQVILDTPYETSTFQSASGIDTLVLNAGASSVNDFYRGYWIRVSSGLAGGHVRRIKTYDGTTKTATIYTTADNSPTFDDGLDLTTLPSGGDGYELFPGTYSGMFFDDTNNYWVIGNVPYDQGAGQFPLNGLHNLRLNSLILDGSVSYGGVTAFENQVIIDYNDTQTFLIRKNGDAGDVFYIDNLSATPAITLNNPVNTVSSNADILLRGYNASANEVSYSRFRSTVLDNSSGAHDGSMSLAVSQNGTLINYLELNGNTQVSSFSSDTALDVLNTTATTSSTTGALRVSGGISISNATDATSSANGGTFTTAGGVAIGKKLFVGDVSTFNTLSAGGASAVITNYTVGGTGKLEMIDEGTSSKPAGIRGVQSSGVGLYGNVIRMYDDTGSTQYFSVSSTTSQVYSSQASTSSSTGALVVSGGVGIGGTLNVGTNLSITGTITSGTWNGATIGVPYGGTGATSLTTNAVLLGNGTSAINASAMSYASSTLSVLNVDITSGTASTSTTTGALRVSGGVGITGALYTGGNITVEASNSSITLNGDAVVGLDTLDGTDTGSLSITGGGALGDTRGSSISLYGNDHLVCAGCVEISAGNNNAFGTVDISTAGATRIQVQYSGVVDFPLTTDSTSSSTGALTMAGGLGVAKKVYIGTELHVGTNSHLGTVSSGTWNGTVVGVAYGGTGATSLTDNAVLLGNGTGAIQTESLFTYESNTLNTPKINSTDTSQSTSTSTGAITVAGGIGVAKNVYLGEDLRVAGTLGIGTTTNINSALTFNSGSNIGVNTVVTEDTGSLFVSGSGSANAARGALISLYGLEHANTGQLVLDAGSVAGASVKIRTQATDRITVSHAGITTLSNTTASTSSTTGALVVSGGVAISDATDAASSTNGGSFTTAGGMAVAKNLYIGGDLHVSGSVPGSVLVSTPVDATFNLVNLSSSNASQRKLLTTGAERTYSCVFTAIATSANATCSFEIDVPSVSTNFASAIDAVATVSGFYDLTNFYSVENIVCYTLTGTTRAKIKFTSSIAGTHYLSIILRYTVS